MTQRKITTQDMDRLVAFLPAFEEPNACFLTAWKGGEATGDGAVTMPYPDYPRPVQTFFGLAGRECWCDYDYEPAEAGAMVADDGVIAAASLAEIKTMLTYMVRGERFCDGHWATMLEAGRVQAVLRRLQALAGKSASGAD